MNAEYAVTSGSATNARCGDIRMLTSDEVGVSGEYCRGETFRWNCGMTKKLGGYALSEQ